MVVLIPPSWFKDTFSIDMSIRLSVSNKATHTSSCVALFKTTLTISKLLVCVCPQTDGASAVLIMSEEKALAMGYKPKAYLRYLHPLCLVEKPQFPQRCYFSRGADHVVFSSWQRLCLRVPGPQRSAAFGVSASVSYDCLVEMSTYGTFKLI